MSRCGAYKIFWPRDVVSIISSYTGCIINDGDWTLKALVYPGFTPDSDVDLTDEQALVYSFSGSIHRNVGLFMNIKECFFQAVSNGCTHVAEYLSGILESSNQLTLAEALICREKAFELDSGSLCNLYSAMVEGYDSDNPDIPHLSENIGEACRLGRLNVFENLLDTLTESLEDLVVPDFSNCFITKACSADKCDMSLIKTLFEHVYEPSRLQEYMNAATSNGHINVVQYLYDEHKSPHPEQLAIHNAISNGHFEMVQYHELITDFSNIPNDTVTRVVINGNSKFYEYLISRVPETIDDRFHISDACLSGNTAFVKYLINKIPDDFKRLSTSNAVRSGSSELVKFLHSLGYRFSSDDINSARISGNRTIAEFLWRNK